MVAFVSCFSDCWCLCLRSTVFCELFGVVFILSLGCVNVLMLVLDVGRGVFRQVLVFASLFCVCVCVCVCVFKCLHVSVCDSKDRVCHTTERER